MAGLVRLALVPFAFLGGLLRTRLTRAGAVGELVARLSEGPTGARAARRAGRALGDPRSSSPTGCPTAAVRDADGHPVELPDAGSEARGHDVERDGRRWRRIVHDAVAGRRARARRRRRRRGGRWRWRTSACRPSCARRLEELRGIARRGSWGPALDERRRLERNLHDGAQQRLVSMALKLRPARERAWTATRRRRAAARRGARRAGLDALEELRELARGIHPAVLTERGLGAALEALAARARVPVQLDVALGERLPEAVEAAAYFVVAEALTNVAKHAARHARCASRSARDDGHAAWSRSPTTAWAAPTRARAPGCAAWPTASTRSAAGSRSMQPARRAARRVPGGDPVRVVIADDSVLLREGLARLLDEAGFEVVGQAGDADELLRRSSAHRPDVAIVDIRMPPTHTDEGLRAALEIRERPSGRRRCSCCPSTSRRATRCELLGERRGGRRLPAQGPRGRRRRRSSTRVRRVAAGGSALDPEVVAQLLGRAAPARPARRAHAREREVLELMAEGRSNPRSPSSS